MPRASGGIGPRLSVHGLHELHGLHAVHALHEKPGENHRKLIPGLDDPKVLQTNPANVAGPSVYSCGIQGTRAVMGRVLHKEKRTHHI